MRNLQKDRYVIVEIIPTHSNSQKGFIAQISALKLNGLELVDRFDYRVNPSLIENQDLRTMTSYDKDMFTYSDNIHFIKEKFKKWAGEDPLMLVDDTYTLSYLGELPNQKELVFPYFELENGVDVFDRLITKYQLQPSNHLVDLIYEAIIYEGNNKKKQKEFH